MNEAKCKDCKNVRCDYDFFIEELWYCVYSEAKEELSEEKMIKKHDCELFEKWYLE